MTITFPNQRCIEDVEEGAALPPLVRTPTRVGVFLYGVAYWTSHRIHYDKEWAQHEGYDDVLVTAGLMGPYLTQMLNAWAGSPWCIRRLSTTNRGYVHPGQRLTATGIVRKVTRDDQGGLVECDVWLQRDDGSQPVVGSTVVWLPSRDRAA